MALTRGGFYVIKYRLLSRGKITIGFPFLCHTPIQIIGKGRVRIGIGCSVFVNNFDRLFIHTLTEDAEVVIGSKCSLGGVTIRCAGRIRVGHHVMMAANLLQDVPFLTSVPTDELQGGSLPLSIVIGNHVWLSARSIVLRHSRMDDRSVLGVGAVLYGQEIGKGCLVLGNPVRRPLPIAPLLQIKDCAI